MEAAELSQRLQVKSRKKLPRKQIDRMWSRSHPQARLKADDLLAEMPDTVSTLEIGAGPADDTVASRVGIPVAVPALLTGRIGIAPATGGSARRHWLVIGRSSH